MKQGETAEGFMQRMPEIAQSLIKGIASARVSGEAPHVLILKINHEEKTLL